MERWITRNDSSDVRRRQASEPPVPGGWLVPGLRVGLGSNGNERKHAYRWVGYEQRFRADATLDDFDLELVQAFLERTPVRKWPVTEALRYYGLIEHAERDWRVTNAALLLFARAPAKK